MHFGVATWWPLWLVLAIPFVWWSARHTSAAISRRRIALAATLRALALLFVALALAAPTLYTPTHAISVVYALDISRSVAPEFLRTALDWMREANAQHRPAHASYVVFADRAQLLNDLGDIPSVAVRQAGENDGSTAVDQSATDIEQAIFTSVFGFLPGYAKRLVLITDGNQTQGDVWRELPRLQSERVRVFAFPAPTALTADAWLEGLEVPDGVRERQPVTLHVRLFSSTATPARLQLTVAGDVVAERSVKLTSGTSEVPFQVRFQRAGANPVLARLATANGHAESWPQSVWVGPRLHLLYVEGSRGAARYLTDALTQQGIEVKSMPPEQFEDHPAAALRGADVVLLSDVPADRLDAEATRRLEEFVRDLGGGLIFVAGENTYGKAGFSGSGVERLLPVKFEARRKRKELDLVLLIDRSFSMHGRKLELAKSAALATLDLLEEQHRLAVVAFDSQPHDVVPLAEVGSKRRAEDLISSMTSAGRTDIYNALWRARELLKNSHAKTKHVILLSDGETAPPPNALSSAQTAADSEKVREMLRNLGYSHRASIERLVVEEAPERPPSASGGFEDLVADMAAAGVTLSTVAVGDKPNLSLMRGLAQWGNGKSYVAERDSEIPALFITEARRLLGESLIEEPFRPRAKGRSEMLAGIDFASGPELKGFVASKAKRFSDVLLQAKQDQPLLAETRYGLGKTVAFLSDAKNRWAIDWLTWPGYAKLWAQVVRDAARGAALQEFAWQVTRHGGEGRLKLIALNPDGTFRNDLWPKARVLQPDGQSTVVVLRQSAPGTYAASIAINPVSAAPYRFELLPGPGLSEQEIARIGARGLYYPQSDELRARPADVAMLKALSERTGGRFAPKTDEIFARSSDGGMLATSLWPLLAAAALLLYLMGIAARRLPWSIFDSAAARR
jgi:Mg-chelatase subunit ChlD